MLLIPISQPVFCMLGAIGGQPPSQATIATNLSIGTLTYFTETNATRLNQLQGLYCVTQLPQLTGW